MSDTKFKIPPIAIPFDRAGYELSELKKLIRRDMPESVVRAMNGERP